MAKTPTMKIVEKEEDEKLSRSETEKAIANAKENSEVITTDDLDFILPIMAGKPVSENDMVKVNALMNREVNAGTVIQIAGYMNALVKEATLQAVRTVLDTQRYQALILKRMDEDGSIHELALEDVKKDDENRAEMLKKLEKLDSENAEK